MHYSGIDSISYLNRKDRYRANAREAKNAEEHRCQPLLAEEPVQSYDMTIEENRLSRLILNAAYHVHKSLGPGLLESAYEECLSYTLAKEGLHIRRQQGLPLVFEEVKMELGYRTDIIVENKVIIEVKSVDSITDVHKAQVLTYLRLSGCKLGLLINFNTAQLKEGIKRLVHGI
jgi:GxxExxY protein